MEIYLRRLIDEQGTSISEIARKMGVSIQYICNVARGQRVSIKILERIADIIGVPAWRLLCPPEDDPITQSRLLQEQERKRTATDAPTASPTGDESTTEEWLPHPAPSRATQRECVAFFVFSFLVAARQREIKTNFKTNFKTKGKRVMICIRFVQISVRSTLRNTLFCKETRKLCTFLKNNSQNPCTVNLFCLPLHQKYHLYV